jgi:predicted lipoprotein with Yx(FWY)xxD motif
MQKTQRSTHRIPYPVRTPILAVAIALTIGAVLAAGALAVTQRTKTVAKEGPSTALSKTVLTTMKGRTLYSLSAEKRGRFICTDPGCLASWKPLVVAKGVRPKGPVKLGTVVRPDGRRQVTFKGLPLYSFNGDVSKGEANGEGLKDVGTWHAVVTGPLASEPQPEPPSPSPEPNPYPTEPKYPY